MSRSRPWSSANPDLRRQTQVAVPAIEPLEQELYNLLSPANFKPLRLEGDKDNKKLRERILTLPVMMAVVLGLVYRRIAGLSEVVRLLSEEGLLWVEPLQVSKQALSKRLMRLPASVFATVFEQVLERLRTRQTQLSLPEGWRSLSENFQAVWIADGSTLEELRRKLKALRDKPDTVLAGKMMMVVEAFTHRPVASWYTDAPKANDKTFADNLLECLPQRGLLVFDLGFFKFGWFDAFTNAEKFFVTRLREKTAYSVTRCLSQGLYHFARAFLRGDATDVVAYLKSKAKLLGVVKARRKRHRDIDAHTQLIWVLLVAADNEP